MILCAVFSVVKLSGVSNCFCVVSTKGFGVLPSHQPVSLVEHQSVGQPCYRPTNAPSRPHLPSVSCFTHGDQLVWRHPRPKGSETLKKRVIFRECKNQNHWKICKNGLSVAKKMWTKQTKMESQSQKPLENFEKAGGRGRRRGRLGGRLGKNHQKWNLSISRTIGRISRSGLSISKSIEKISKSGFAISKIIPRKNKEKCIHSIKRQWKINENGFAISKFIGPRRPRGRGGALEIATEAPGGRGAQRSPKIARK